MPGRRTIVVGKGVQIALFVLYTTIILMLTLVLEGHSERMVNVRPLADLRFLLRQVREGRIFNPTPVAVLAGVFMNVLLFYLWALYLFRILWTKHRHTLLTTLYTLLAGIGLSVSIEVLQLFIAGRASDVNDLIYNTTGVLMGTTAAYLGKVLRIEFR